MDLNSQLVGSNSELVTHNSCFSFPHKIGQSAEFSGRLLGLLLKTGLPLMKNILKPLVKSVLIPLVLETAASATDAAII